MNSTPSSRKKSVTSTSHMVSPVKRGSTSLQNTQRDLVQVDKDLIRGLSKKEVEIDHLKSALQAVSLRLEVLKDMERDVQNSQALTHDSELKRAKLQDMLQ